MIRYLSSLSQAKRIVVLSLFGLMVSAGISWLTFISPIGPVMIIAAAFFLVYVISLFKAPEIGLIVLIIYCFIFGILAREVGGVPYGIGIEVFLLVLWIAVIIQHRNYDWKRINNPLTKLMLVWFIISFIEVINPAGASVRGWLQEIRSTALFPVLAIPLAFLLFDSEKKLNIFLILIIGLSFLATLNGIKQQHFGLSAGEQRFLDEGGAVTHLLWGKLRVFSFYSDSGQFGASQASFVLVAIVLAVGPFKVWKRLLFLFIAGLSFYGMLISGTRGALFALIIGALFAIFLTKNIKVLVFGLGISLMFVFFLKYTTIGNGSYEIFRLRSAFDPKEASLNVRFNNQKMIGEYLRSRPFGGGLGVIGTWGKEYNKDKFLSTIEPDSYWVKLWAMYGIIGFTIWFCMIMYILGKCCGIIWNIRDNRLRYKNIAILAATAGLFFCSYGNEVMNTMPSALVVSFSLAFIFMSPGFDRPAPELTIEEEKLTN